MEGNTFPGLNKLSRVISDALTIENCSICLERLKDTVLLWPCSHWFCHGCIKQLHSKRSGKKTLCPLCNGATTRRSILPFHDKQKEYEDHLQTLIGAISLDLGFDVTSFNIHSNSDQLSFKNPEVNNKVTDLSPLRKTRQKTTIKCRTKDDPDPVKCDSKRVTRSKKLKSIKTPGTAQSSTICKLPDTPDDYKEKKVQDWLTVSRFSIGEQNSMTESAIDEANKTDLELPSFSEDQLKSVSQVKSNIMEAPYGQGTEKQKSCLKSSLKKSKDSSIEKFDNLLLKEKNSRFISTTYGSKNVDKNRKSKGRCFVVESDIFNTTVESKGNNNISEKLLTNSPEDNLEDFSSGSGEEWCLNKKRRKPAVINRNRCLQTKKTPVPTWKNEKVSKISERNQNKFPNSKKSKNHDMQKMLIDKKCDLKNNLEVNKSNTLDKGKLVVGKSSKSELKKGIGETALEIIKDWDFTSDINCGENQSRHLVGEMNNEHTKSFVRVTPIKQDKPRSPGWSRLTKTKEDFHVTDKKKLSLKTLNKTSSTDTTPLSHKHDTSKQSSTVIDESPRDCKVTCDLEKLPFPQTDVNVNRSSSSTCTPFKGFEVPAVTKKRERDSGICNQSSLFDSPEPKRTRRDAEVQTSPSQMQACIKDYLKKMWGKDAEELFNKVTVGGASNVLPKEPCLKNLCDPQVIENEIPAERNTYTQDSDKENINVLTNNSISSEKCNDSDFVLGTEDYVGVTKIGSITKDHKHKQFDVPKVNSTPTKCEDMIIDRFDVDPDAITQPYLRTPVVPQPTMKSSTVKSLYSAVSNPTDSELKRVEEFFLQNETIYPGVTPVAITPWNDSGIVQLEKSSEAEKKTEVDTRTKSQELKRQSNRSRPRRQLDFIEDSNCNDLNMFETSPPGNSCDRVETTNPSSEKEPCQVVEQEICSKLVEEHSQKPSYCPEDQKERHIGNKVLEDVYEEMNGEVSDAASEDCFVEGTPDVSQSDIPQQQQIVDDNAMDFVSTCKLSTLNPDVDGKDEPSSISKLENIIEENVFKEPSQKLHLINNVNNCCNQSVKDLFTASENQEVKAPCNISLHDNQKGNDESNCDQQEENSEIAENTEDIDITNYCFASSLLSVEQNNLLMTVLKGLNMNYSRTVGNHISHLIVSTSNGCTKNTYKVLYAMALHKPIIRFEWVEHVLRTGGTVPLDPFIALDPSGECGVLRAKKDKERELLRQFAIHVYNVIESVIKKEQIEELVRLCGGTVVPSLHQFPAVPRDLHRVIILSEPPESCTQAEWRQRYSAAEVSIDWLYNTIGRYKVVPIASYMVEQDGAVRFLLHEGYPDTLVFDTSVAEL